jgi:hypothetical protein
MEEISKCPMCGVPVRVIRRDDGMADHYEALTDGEANFVPNPISPHLDGYLKGKRKGKRTVAIVGSAYTTGPWAPFGEPGIEVWCENEMHVKPWVNVDGVTAWFQLHPKWSFEKEHRSNHREWLTKDWPFHIYMQRTYDNIPRSIAYPLREVQGLIDVERGEEKIEKIFTSSFAYMTALALQQKKFDRIEIFGIELLLEGEYAYQREAMAYWIGQADGLGIDVWLPEQCDLLRRPLYAYEEIRIGGTAEIATPPQDAEW